MKKLLETWSGNRVYFIPYLVFLAFGMGMVMATDKGQAVLWFNAHHSRSLDLFFSFWTKMGEEWPFIIAGIVLVFYKVRNAGYMLLLGGMSMLLSFILKQFFAHPRPARFFADQGIYQELNKVEFIRVAEGYTSFPSGHTMAAFALFTFLALNARQSVWKLVFLGSAILVAVSRMYLLQHFLQDVCLGSVCGIIIALTVYRIEVYYNTAGKADRWNLPVREFIRSSARS